MVKELTHCRFQVEFGGIGQRDIFALFGIRDGEEVIVSYPVAFDEVKGIIKTVSGSFYKIDNIEAVADEIKVVVARGGYRSV